jgi:hypothetical protein
VEDHIQQKANAWRSGGVEEPRGKVRGTKKNKGEKQLSSKGPGGTKRP